MSKSEGDDSGRKVIITNRKARHEYDILDTFEAGLVLTGAEIKSIRAGNVRFADAHVTMERGEAWLQGMHIAPYEQAGRSAFEPDRRRKLLLHRAEIERLTGRINEKGWTMVPLSLYLRRGFAKLELALARGRQLHDRRRAIADREIGREKERALAGRD